MKFSNERGMTNCSKEMIVIKQIKKFLTALVIAYIPSLLIIAALVGGDSAFFDTSFAFDLLIVLLYTLPVFVGIIEIVICVIRTIESKKRVSLYNSITTLIALSAIILTFVLSEMIYVSVIMAALLLVIELIYWIKENRRLDKISFVKQISFWVIVLAILLAVTLCASAYSFLVDAENKVDPLDGIGDNSDNIVDLEKQITIELGHKARRAAPRSGQPFFCFARHHYAHSANSKTSLSVFSQPMQGSVIDCP